MASIYHKPGKITTQKQYLGKSHKTDAADLYKKSKGNRCILLEISV
jgi:hypothetical protein